MRVYGILWSVIFEIIPAHHERFEWGLCEYVIVHTILPSSPVILWIELGGKTKWLPINFGYHNVMRIGPIDRMILCDRKAAPIASQPLARVVFQPSG